MIKKVGFLIHWPYVAPVAFSNAERLSLWSLNPFASLSSPMICCPGLPAGILRPCSRSCPGPCAGLRSFYLFGFFAYRRLEVLGFFVLVSQPAKDFIWTKLVPITSNDVMAAIINILFVLFILAIQVHFMV